MTQDITMTDMFCGAGGTTTGAIAAGVDVRLAINHWSRAIETHNHNHPQTTHILTDLHKANPRRFRTTTGLAASPECTAHTLAKGQKRKGQNQPELWETEGPDLAAEAEERSRCTMWTPLDWAEYHDYQFVLLENVVDAHLWRPFESWLQAWKSLDYDFELVYFNSMHAHPTPQSRDRMYFVAWKRKNKRPDLKICPSAYCGHCQKDVASVQSWKKASKRCGKYRQQYVYRCPGCAGEITPYYYAAANAVDWSLPAPKIGDRKKPLREKTMGRIAYGLEKFAHAQALLLQTSHGESGHASYVASVHHTPFPTQTTRQDLAVAVPPFLINLNHPNTRTVAIEEQPFPTQTAYDDLALVHPRPFILDHLGEYRPRSITGPISTICAAGNHHSLVVPPPQQSWLMTYYNHGQLAPIEEAVPTVTTLARHALVTHEEQENAHPIAVDDCGFRMLVPKEIQAAMAFPGDYIVTGTRREQVKQLGNACTPPVIELLMRRLIASLQYSGVATMEESQLTLWDTEQEPSAGAVIVGPYRYTLWRQWDSALPRVLFIMLNPSRASAMDVDPTLRRCLAFVRSWGMGSIEVVNLYAYITPYPAVLKQAKDAIGAENDVYIQQAIRRASLIVCAWGACKLKGRRETDVLRLLQGREAYCLGLTKEQCPCHPLYLAGDTPLVRYPA